MASFYTQGSSFSPARSIVSPQLRTDSDVESHYLRELLLERENFEPFMPIFPNCTRLLNQELLQISGRIFSLGLSNYGTLPLRSSSPVALPDMMIDMPGSSTWNGSGWNDMQIEVFQMPQGVSMDRQLVLRSSSSVLARKIMRMDVPVDRYPNFNYVGRLLGPRGNSLKRIEAATGCRIFIRGWGSIKDPAKEERLRGKPGHAHLNEPLHVVIDAHLPVSLIDEQLMLAKEIIQEILKPVESMDFYKRQQMRELAVLNSIGA